MKVDPGGIIFRDLAVEVALRLTDNEKARLGSVGWYTTTVKLELEVRGEIEREPRSNPQRLRLPSKAPLDEIALYNRERWNDLVDAGIVYSRPFLELTEAQAWQELDPYGVLEEVKDKDTLVLAGGGGQQSAAFAFLGARVTVFDLSDKQLEKDALAAAHYNFPVRIERGDMRDLSRFADQSFDIVYQPYSINFIPDPTLVFEGVKRILRTHGLYRVDFANPFTMGLEEQEWNGKGYPLYGTYRDEEMHWDDNNWDVWHADGTVLKIQGPREFRHTLGHFVNSLIKQGFLILGMWEELSGDPQAEPGTWEHYKAVAPPWLMVWSRLEEKV